MGKHTGADHQPGRLRLVRVQAAIHTFRVAGERIPTDVVYYDGSDPVRMHNHYTPSAQSRIN